MRAASGKGRAIDGEQFAAGGQFSDGQQIVIFEVERQRFALPLTVVERAECAVAITALAHAPSVIAGVVNVRGRIIPVIALRALWNLPERPLALSDQLLIVSGARRCYALLIDCVVDVAQCDDAAIALAQTLAIQSDSLRGAVSLSDGIVFIHDLDRFLTLDAEYALDKALENV